MSNKRNRKKFQDFSISFSYFVLYFLYLFLPLSLYLLSSLSLSPSARERIKTYRSILLDESENDSFSLVDNNQSSSLALPLAQMHRLFQLVYYIRFVCCFSSFFPLCWLAWPVPFGSFFFKKTSLNCRTFYSTCLLFNKWFSLCWQGHTMFLYIRSDGLMYQQSVVLFFYLQSKSKMRKRNRKEPLVHIYRHQNALSSPMHIFLSLKSRCWDIFVFFIVCDCV